MTSDNEFVLYPPRKDILIGYAFVVGLPLICGGVMCLSTEGHEKLWFPVIFTLGFAAILFAFNYSFSRVRLILTDNRLTRKTLFTEKSMDYNDIATIRVKMIQAGNRRAAYLFLEPQASQKGIQFAVGEFTPDDLKLMQLMIAVHRGEEVLTCVEAGCSKRVTATFTMNAAEMRRISEKYGIDSPVGDS